MYSKGVDSTRGDASPGPPVTSRGGAVAPADHPERLDERVVEAATTK